MKDAWPIRAQATGGRHYRGNCHRPELRQLLGRIHLRRRRPSCSSTAGRSTAATSAFASYAHGTKGSAIISFRSHGRASAASSRARTSRRTRTWSGRIPQPEPNPYQIEWDDLIDAIRQDKPYNEVKRGAEASLVTCMGRMAAHTGQVDHLRPDAQPRARVCPGRRQADDGFARAAAGRPRRQVSRPAAGHRHQAGILSVR